MEGRSETHETLDMGQLGVGEVQPHTDHKSVIFEIKLTSFTKAFPLDIFTFYLFILILQKFARDDLSYLLVA